MSGPALNRLAGPLFGLTLFNTVYFALGLWPLPRLWYLPVSHTWHFGVSAKPPAMGLYGQMLAAGAALALGWAIGRYGVSARLSEAQQARTVWYFCALALASTGALVLQIVINYWPL